MSPRNVAPFARLARLARSFALLTRLGAAGLALTAVPASANTGVSEERVSLPDGPGSIGGIGENALVEGNMGSMSLSVPLRVPPGFAGVTPGLALGYGSESGASVVGIGWSFGSPSIDRMTSRGLPEYTTADRFAADGSDELVKVSETMTSAVYRARYEGAFVRYTWHLPADGKGGYFTAESPDGLITYYGADRSGNLVPSARITHPDGGVYSYLAVETVDPFGHRLHYAYATQDGYPLVDTIDYAHDAAGTARFSVRFVYEERPDVVSDGKPGFELRLTSRLSEVRVFSGSEQIRSYALEYETVSESGGMSRLRSVAERGRGGELYPIKQSFAYSRALGGACVTDCEKPFVVDMGTLSGGVDMQSGASTLIDINGDGLPDVLDTTGGVHRFYLAQPAENGRPTFAEKAMTSTSSTSAFVLGAPSVQVVDVDGNGFTDMISTKTGDVLCNDGSGDWNGTACLADASLDIELEDDPDESGEADPLHVRFFDYDND
ncbi:MAG TPA: SpvB/TcaC N-terminal domain-containing protein, partial [Polyangiales bacterium]|nr:SpvB/TcaC N-terminal domain-containing protein [Polyangiales bacterium]